LSMSVTNFHPSDRNDLSLVISHIFPDTRTALTHSEKRVTVTCGHQ
jgi:hypothetical protein